MTCVCLAALLFFLRYPLLHEGNPFALSRSQTPAPMVSRDSQLMPDLGLYANCLFTSHPTRAQPLPNEGFLVPQRLSNRQVNIARLAHD